MSARTVTVVTRNGIKATVTEPSWCVGDHPQGIALADVSHRGAEQVFRLPDGMVVATAELAYWPYIRGARPIVGVELGVEDTEHDDEQLQDLAQGLLVFAAIEIPMLRAMLAAAVEEASL